MFVPILSNDDLRNLPLIQFEGPVRILNTPEQTDKAVEVLRQHKILGFDTETRPAFVKRQTHKVALLQLATPSEAFLFRMPHTGIPDSLAGLLSDPNILKIGVAIGQDIEILKRRKPFVPAGFLDLQHFVKPFGIESQALTKLSGIILGCRISKAQRLSNWESEELSEGQVRYAATDAWICLKIYERLIQKTVAAS